MKGASKIMINPKMELTFIGIDSHKDTHTAVLINCFFERLGEVTFRNLPSEFPGFLLKAEELKEEGTRLVFGLEDVSMYGRALAVFLKNNNQQAKHVNALLVAKERKNQNVTQKTDSVDAECAARVLLSKFDELPGSLPDDKYYILKTMVSRRGVIIKNNISLKNHLHSLVTQHYPNYTSIFRNIDGKSALAFFYCYPSPQALDGVGLEELAGFFKEVSQGKVGFARARMILETREDTAVPFQEVRDEAVRSTIRQIEVNLLEIQRLEASLAEFLKQFECSLTSMKGIDVVSAAQIMACIGDVRKFPTPAKLARYAGVAPVTYASGRKNIQFANQRGNRELNSIFHLLAVRLITTLGPANKILNPFFKEYYERKISEGKTKRQALKSVERRLVNIIWGMLTNNEEYVNPPLIINEKRARALDKQGDK
jgi:transposase